jgi:hypothetical protein
MLIPGNPAILAKTVDLEEGQNSAPFNRKLLTLLKTSFCKYNQIIVCIKALNIEKVIKHMYLKHL